MFERYTEKARRVIFFARYEASQFRSPYIESEHLLLGLLRESKALSARLFTSSPGAIDRIRKQIEGHATIAEKIPTSVDLPISEECKRILLYASEEADRLTHKHIGTEHLLLGMLREQNCYAARLLNENGAALESARSQVSGGARDERGEAAFPPKSPGMPAGVHLAAADLQPGQRNHHC
ncbi:MAG TPA: Clp protease N-terminal domain-containing protein [Terriglobales bacterium]|nr:Clp protease N-terminal domain-containing protein [Terriglobales bacterium]